MNTLRNNLRRTEKEKLASSTAVIADTTTTPRPELTTRRKNRRFDKSLRKKKPAAINIEADEDLPLNQDEELTHMPDISPINLASTGLTEPQAKILAKGPSFCPTPKDVNWLKVQDDLDKFERRIRIAVHFGTKNHQDRPESQHYPPVPSKSTWNPPKSTIPEVELFLSNIREDILDPQNSRTPKDNLSVGERRALKDLRNDDRVIRIQDKGSRFVILDKSTYTEKVREHLDNELHYNKVNEDPTGLHFSRVQQWTDQWLQRREITSELADWITDVEPKPGVAFGNIKTHKEGNPLRLITSCCGTAIERLSAFTEFYLKPLAQKLPSFLKDTTDLINKINDLNSKGPLPEGTLLVSWDVVAMFPNIDNDLGISAARKALDSRVDKLPSTDCIIEAIQICLNSNNSEFGGNHFVQRHGTAMGPKNACSYADLAMGELDKLAKDGGPAKPNLWWRYRDDIIDVWTHGLPKLYEFTDYINSLYPTIKFELVHSEVKLNVLDLTLQLTDGYIVTDTYAKPTDSYLYLPYDSSHPIHCKQSIPYGVALRLHRNCATPAKLKERSIEYKRYLIRQGYPKPLINNKFNQAFKKRREELLTPSTREKKRILPLVLDFNPILPDISGVIKKHVHLLQDSNAVQHLFPPRSIIPSFRRSKNLKEILAPSKVKKSILAAGPLVTPGCFKCNSRRCDLCFNFLIESHHFESFATGKQYFIRHALTCSSKNVIYLAACTKCRVQYVGSSTSFKERFRNHKSHMLNNRRTCEVAIHFNETEHTISDFKFICIEKLIDVDNVEAKLLNREAYWTAQLKTLRPYGLNKRKEFRSKNRIQFKN